MDYIQTANKQVDKFGVGKHGFSAGNPSGGVLATLLSNTWCDGIQEEIINVIEAAGLAPSGAVLNQLAIALQSGKLFSAAAAGTSDAITAAFTPVVTALKDGMALYVRGASANATTTPTFTPAAGTIAVKTIVKGAGIALAAGDIAGAGHWVELQYDLALDKWVLLNPATGVTTNASASVRGAFSNLSASANGISSNVAVAADEIVVESAGNVYQTLRGVNVSINSASVGANGLDTGTLGGSTFYAMWIIWNGITTSGLLSLSSTAPTMPSGYTHKARVGWIRTDGSGNKYPWRFNQFGSDVQITIAAGSNITTPIVMASGAAGNVSTPTFVAVGTGSYVPSTAARIRGVINPGVGAVGTSAIVAPDAAYPAVGGGIIGFTCPASTGGSAVPFDFAVESNNLYWASNGAGSQLCCFGWRDNL